MSNILSRNLVAPNATNGISGLIDGVNGLKSFADGSAAGAGYLGYRQAATGSAVSAVTGQWVDVATVTISAGDWIVDANVYFDTNGATMTTFTFEACVIPDSGNTSGSSVAGVNVMSLAPGGTFSGSLVYPMTFSGLRASSNGTDVQVEGQSGGTATQVVRLKAFLNGISSGTPKFTGSIRARISR